MLETGLLICLIEILPPPGACALIDPFVVPYAGIIKIQCYVIAFKKPPQGASRLCRGYVTGGFEL